MQGTSEVARNFLDAFGSCRELIPNDSVEAFLSEHRLALFPDEMFEDLFPSSTGRPSVPGDVIGAVMILQSLEGLSDRDAAKALRDRISWKVACGLNLDDKGVDFSVLTYWRRRLAASDRPDRVFDAIKEIACKTNVLAKRHKRALDSTILDDAVATQDTVTQIIAQVRRVRKMIIETKNVELTAHDYESGKKPVCQWDDPLAKEHLVTNLVNDATTLLEVVKDLELDADQQLTVGLLALVAGQDVEPGETEGSWRIANKTVPDRVISTVDTQTRHGHKTTSRYQNGFKAHVAMEPETGIITAATLTPANSYDGSVAAELVDSENCQTLPDAKDTAENDIDSEGFEVYADSAYGSREVRAALKERGHVAIIKPLPTPKTIPDGFERDDFKIDHENQSVTCPAGNTVIYRASGNANFNKACSTCNLKSLCTQSARGRVVHVRENDELLVAARQQFKDADVIAKYKRWRPPVERAIAWLTAKGNRRVRYRGVTKNTTALRLRVGAINLRRLINLGLYRVEDVWCVP